MRAYSDWYFEGEPRGGGLYHPAFADQFGGACPTRYCLNVGCGRKPSADDPEAGEAWINLDWAQGPGVNVVRDLKRGLPFNNAEFHHVYCDNVLEHFAQDDAIFLINEIDRVLVVGGTTLIIVPHKDSEGAVQDPTHRSLWTPRSALYWNQFTTPYGGTSVGITANLHATLVEVTLGTGQPLGSGVTAEWLRNCPEYFIRFHCVKRAHDYAPKVTP